MKKTSHKWMVPQNLVVQDNSIMDFRVSWCRFVTSKSDSSAFINHKHSIYELQCIVLGHAAVMLSNSHEVEIPSGSYILIPAEVTHRITYESDDISKLCIGYQAKIKETTLPLQNSKEPANLVQVCSENMLALADILKSQFQQGVSIYQHYPMLLSQCIIHEALNPYFLHNRKSDRLKSLSKSMTQELIDMMEAFMGEHIHFPLRVCDLASAIGVSQYQLNSFCKQAYNMTAYEYIQSHRITYSQHLLENSTLTLSEIAESLGFSSVYSFIRFFKSSTDVSPGKFRRESKQQPFY